MSLPWWRRLLFTRSLRQPSARPVKTRRKTPQLTVEPLEDRTLLSVTSEVTGRQVFLTGTVGQDIYLRTNSDGFLEFSPDGTDWTSDLNDQGNPELDIGKVEELDFDDG